jgi:prepilin-type N-terminal cleavage/methylation domain-containing protein
MSQMHSLKGLKKSKGFTLVELLIVIVVIGILATLVIVTFSGIQQRARDTQRQTDINAIQGHMEAYYAQNGTYPTLAMITDATWRAANMKGLDPEALDAPDGTTIAAAAAANGHYQLTTSVGGAACTVTGAGAAMTADCDAYTLTADLEGSGTNYVKQSN